MIAGDDDLPLPELTPPDQPVDVSSVADAFKKSVAAAGEGVTVAERATGAKRGRKPKAATAVEPAKPVTLWRADGIGVAVAAGYDAVFAAINVAPLSEKEKKELAEVNARALNYVWPEGAPWEPAVALLMVNVQIIAPRVVAYKAMKAQETKDNPDTQKTPDIKIERGG